MARSGGGNNMPDLPISAVEIEVIKMARGALPKAMKRLIHLAQSGNPSQSRQAIELLFKYGLADRQQQFDIQGEPVEDGKGGGQINLTLNKFELQLNELMKQMTPATRDEFAQVIAKMQQEADEKKFDIIEGTVIQEPEMERCACGCGDPVKPGRKWVHGHHLRGHVSTRVPPHEIKRLKEAGQWDHAKEHFGHDKKKAASLKKQRILEKRAKKKALQEIEIVDGES